MGMNKVREIVLGVIWVTCASIPLATMLGVMAFLVDGPKSGLNELRNNYGEIWSTVKEHGFADFVEGL